MAKEVGLNNASKSTRKGRASGARRKSTMAPPPQPPAGETSISAQESTSSAPASKPLTSTRKETWNRRESRDWRRGQNNNQPANITVILKMPPFTAAGYAYGPVLADLSYQQQQPIITSRYGCREYNYGNCRFGSSCRNQHGPDGKSLRDLDDKNVCVFFLLGRCNYPLTCFYLHNGSRLEEKDLWHNPVLLAEGKAFLDRAGLDPSRVAVQVRDHLLSFKAKLDSMNSTVVSHGSTHSRAITEETETSGSERPDTPENVIVPEEPQSAYAPHDTSECDGILEEDTSVQNERPEPSVPFILELSFKDHTDGESKQKCHFFISKHINLYRAHDAEEALKLLSSTLLSGVFVADASITEAENVDLLDKLIQFNKLGGTVVLGGLFANDFPFVETNFKTFFQENWDLSWEPGSFSPSYFKANVSNKLVNSCAKLSTEYQMMALCVKGVPPDDVVYWLESDESEPVQAPVVFTKVGEGHLGFIGDAEWEEGSTTAILAMFGLIPAVKQQENLPRSGPPLSSELEFHSTLTTVLGPSPPQTLFSAVPSPQLGESSREEASSSSVEILPSQLVEPPEPEPPSSIQPYLTDQTEVSSQLETMPSPPRSPSTSQQEEPLQLGDSSSSLEKPAKTH